MRADTLNGHNAKIVEEFNKVAERFSDSDLLDIIISKWADDQDLEDITETLKDLLTENSN
jgi:hypothetical protein